MNLLLSIKRPFIWLSRFLLFVAGYGVHSPFAFSLITDVIYEYTPYYAYHALQEEQRKKVRECGWSKSRGKINRFLFRLVNKVQPATVIEVGQPSTASLYLQSAKPSCFLSICFRPLGLFLDADTPVDFLYRIITES